MEVGVAEFFGSVTVAGPTDTRLRGHDTCIDSRGHSTEERMGRFSLHEAQLPWTGILCGTR